MKKIGIINFNSSSFSDQMLKCDFLHTIRLDVQVNDVSYIDSTLDELFKVVDEVKVIPKTSQPAPQEILNVLKQTNELYENIIILTPTPELSGTHQVTVNTLSECDFKDKFTVVDTSSFALSEAILCDKAINLINQNVEIENIISSLDSAAQKITTFIVPGNFDYLKMGGRVNLSKAIIGKLMNLKLLIKHDSGLADVYKKTRGMKKLFLEIEQELTDDNIDFVYTGEINADTTVLDHFKSLFKNTNVVHTSQTSIVMAAHFGPNTLGFAIVKK